MTPPGHPPLKKTVEIPCIQRHINSPLPVTFTFDTAWDGGETISF